MSYLAQYRQKAWELAYWYFAGQDYINDECESLAGEFVEYAVENINDKVTLEDLFAEFLGDTVFAEQAEADKERSLHA